MDQQAMSADDPGTRGGPTAEGIDRRGAVALLLMAAGLVLSYGLLVAQGVAFLLPRRLRPRTRLLFAGHESSYPIGGVRTVHDLRGDTILVTRDADGFRAFSSVCPHLGCHVHWIEREKRFLCPCHNGVFDAEGVAISGPPADAQQRLATVPLEVDARSGVVYLEVRDAGRRAV
jgi:Rieske Fe-S protein